MQVKDALFNRVSEDEFAQKLLDLGDSGAGIIHVRTDEMVRTIFSMRKTILANNYVYKEWDIVNGVAEIQSRTMVDRVSGDKTKLNLMAALDHAMEDAHSTESLAMYADESNRRYRFYVMVNPQYFWEAPAIVHLLQQISYRFSLIQARLILVSSDVPLPPSLSSLCPTIRMEPPGLSELQEAAEEMFQELDEGTVDVDDEGLRSICYAGSGMSRASFETALSLSLVENFRNGADVINSEALISGVSKGKVDIVNRNELLELFTAESIGDVGGMQNLKNWVTKRSACYTDEAAQFGVEPPKGIVFVGPPGTGKSLAAKAIAGVLGTPLVRLDFGKVFNSLVGKSEEQMRTALRMVEYMAPVVLFVDEIDKGLGGIGGGGGDSGTSMRVLGTFLTWLQECKAPVFTMVTANNVTGLPPELMRRGRFDAVFATGMPEIGERTEVINIHLRKRNKTLSTADIRSIAVASKGYVPAEIESAIKDGIVDAYASGEELEAGHVIAALHAMVPLSKAFNEQIQVMTLWAKANATPASIRYEDEGVDDSNVTTLDSNKKNRSRINLKPPKDKD